jgi:fatty acid CoA ligase FadD22
MQAAQDHNGSIFAVIEARSDRYAWGARTAFYEGAHSLTFSDVFARTRDVAAKLLQIGVSINDRVLIEMPDSVGFVTSFLGALYIGAIPIPLNPELHPEERGELLSRANARLLISSSMHSSASIAQVHPDHLLSEAKGRVAPPVAALRSADDVAYGVYSSGTTGLPKIIFHTHADALLFTSVFAGHLGIGPTDVSVSAARMCFAAGLGNSLLFPLLRGGSAILHRVRPTPQIALGECPRPATILYGPPSFYAQVLENDLGPLLAGLRIAACGGAVLPLQLEKRLRRFLDDRLVNIFGSSEIGHAMVVNGPGHHLEGATGRTLPPYQVRVVDEAGSALPPNVEGRLEVAGPTIAVGVEYGSMCPNRVSPDKWYRTGDVATINDDGFIHISGRADDIEIVGGQNVHPSEIESTLLELEQVQRVAVYSSVQPDGSPLLKAIVVPAHQDSSADKLLEIVKAHVSKKLSWYKVPQALEIVDNIPLTTFGKIDRKAIRRKDREQAYSKATAADVLSQNTAVNE